MTETSYVKDENNKISLPFQEGLIPLVGIIPNSGGFLMTLTGESFSLLNQIAQDLEAIDQVLSANLTVPNTPRITQVSLNLKNTQYAFQFPQGTKKYSVRNRGFDLDEVGTIRYAYQPNLVANALFDGTNGFGVLNPRDVLIEEGLHLTQDTTIYFASDVDNVPLTIEYWT